MKKQALNKWVFIGAAMLVALACYPKKPQAPLPSPPCAPEQESSKGIAPSIPVQAPAIVETTPPPAAAAEHTAPAIVQESVPPGLTIVQVDIPVAPATQAPNADENTAVTPAPPIAP